MSALPKPEQLVDDFMLNDRRFGDSDLKLIIRSSGRSSFGIIPGMVCVFDSSMGDGQVFQVHCAIKKEDGPSVLAPYARKRTQDRFILLQSLYQYVDAESDDPMGWPLEFAGQRLLQLRKDLKLHPVVLARQLGVSPLDLSMWEAGRISPGPAMYEWCRALGIFCPANTALVQVVDISPALLRALKENPDEFRRLQPDQFEAFVANRLDRMGFNVKLTGSTNRKDGGIDIIAVPKTMTAGSYVLAAQVKHHRGEQTTGRDAVDRLLAWKGTDIGLGMLVTNTSFTKDALWRAAQEGSRAFLRLRDFLDLKRWLQDQYGSPEDWREIPDTIELAPGVVVEVPKPHICAPLREDD